ncbi:SIR2 family protein, partial [Anaerosolibacter sp.]|uniref:SIR2 family protein n=1 Tax=Anaerosolibacter sp. TaxID=1872527 RepID=UPI0039EEE0EE
LSTLLKHLSRTANPEIKRVTTNYDRIAEYAIDHAYLEFSSGFSGYYKQYFSGFQNNKKRHSNNIELLKVHGSLDWFVDEDSNVVALPDAINEGFNLMPLMVTPGVRKYEHTHNEPFRSIITKSDETFEKASSVLCIGYGFNDIHIQPKLINKIRGGKIPILIIARTLTERALKFIRSSQDENIIGIEMYSDGSKIISSFDNDIIIDEEIWSLSGLLNLIL